MDNEAKVVKLYIHNLVLTNMPIWDPNPYLGDAHLLALESWLRHEEIKTGEVKNTLDG